MTRYEAYERTIERYANSNMYSVFDAYAQPSEQKIRAEKMIRVEMDMYNGYDYRILSYNTFRFTCAYKYEDMKNGAGCVTKEGILKNKDELEGGKCFFANLNNDKGYKVKNSKHSVRAYIEGMSKRKMGFVTWLTSSSVENGQEYYFLDFADVKELKDWTIFDYQSDRIGIYNEKIYYENGSKFEVITFKKGDNYVISYRGTDFPDVWEWLDDFAYALTGTSNTQTKKAYEYAQNVYDLIRDDNKNANIYVTGHSLGAFLAQVGGAAIVDKEAGINLYDAKELASHSGKISDLENLDDYKKMYHKTNSRLKQVAYFNGMGITGIIRSGVFSRSMNSSLIYLSTHNQDGSVATGDKTVNYSTDNMPLKSSGRLVLYTMEGDPISNIGFHYGEIYELSVGTGAIKNHVGNHSHILNGEGLSDIANLVTDLFNGEYVSKYTITENLSKTAANFIKLTEKANNLVPNKNIPKFVSTYNPDIKNYSIMSLITNFLNSKKKLADKYNINGMIDFFNVGHETDSFVCLSDGENGKIEDADTLNFAFAAPNRLKLKTDNHLSDLYQSETYAKYLQPEGYNVGDFINYNLEDLPNYLILDIIV